MLFGNVVAVYKYMSEILSYRQRHAFNIYGIIALIIISLKKGSKTADVQNSVSGTVKCLILLARQFAT